MYDGEFLNLLFVTMTHNLMLFFIFALFANISFAAVDDKVGNVNYLKILQDKESSKNQDYGFEVEGAGLYLAPYGG